MPHAVNLDVDHHCSRIRHILGKQERRTILISVTQLSRSLVRDERASRLRASMRN
jgi:hypothetical protein